MRCWFQVTSLRRTLDAFTTIVGSSALPLVGRRLSRKSEDKSSSCAGRDDQDQNLVIAREYISHGLRERAAALVTLDLGPRTTLGIEERLRHDIDAERLTPIDPRLVRDMDDATSGSGDSKRTHVLVKPFTAGLATNVVTTTDRRTYHLALTSTDRTAMSALPGPRSLNRIPD